LQLWSVLQTFLQTRSHAQCSEWFKKIYIIVPYDPSGLRKIWRNPDTVKSFLDKCFQVRLEVPKPIMSDWEHFAESQIIAANLKK